VQAPPAATEAATPSARPSPEPITAAFDAPRRRTLREELAARFRLHTEEHEAPANWRLFVFCLWAAASIFVGLIPAARLVFTLTLESGPWWYPAAATTLGILGVALMVAAFAAIHRRYLPWYLFVLATLLLAANVTMVYTLPLFS
jgi:hypothetical protein